MRLLRDLPFKRKLTVINLLTSGAALVLTCIAFIAYEQVSYRRDMTRELDITAHIIGANIASSLSFEDNDSAALTLDSLAEQPPIIRACVYDKSGKVFATYRRASAPEETWPAPRSEASLFDRNSLHLFHPIVLAGETIGTIYLQSDLNELRDRRWSYLTIAAAVLLAAMFVTWLIASRLQRLITEPISQLAAIAGRVGAEKAYSIRAIKQGDDEIGRLVDGFNTMLAQIETRDAELHAAHKHLEQRVEERTRSLENARRELLAEKTRFQFIFDHAPVGISLHSSSEGLLRSRMINEAHLRICGLAREDVGDDYDIFGRMTHPDDYARQLPLRESMERGEIPGFSLEKRYLRPDGKIAWVVFTATRIDFADGRAEAMSTISDITALKQAEEDTARERERFKFIFESLPVGVSLFSEHPVRVSCSFLVNDAQLQIIGVSREEAMADQTIFNRLTHPEDAERQLLLRRRLDANEIDRYTIEKRYIRPDGETIWVSFSTQRKIYPNDHQETLSVIVDITGLKLAQEEAAREQTRLKFIFDSVPVGISLYSGTHDKPDLSFLINDAHLDICGLTRDEVALNGRVFGEITHPEDAQRQRPLTAALNTGAIPGYTIEKRYLRADGRVVWATFSAKRIHYPDGRVETLGTVVDITALKLAQQEAAREQARFKFIFDSLPVGVSWRLLGPETLLLNPAHEKITGVPPALALADPDAFARATHPEDLPRQARLAERMRNHEIDEFVIEKRYIHPDGKIVWVVMMSRTSTDQETGKTQSVTTLVDITDLKLAQEEIARERARFKFIFDALPLGVAWMIQGRRDTRIINQSFAQITGVPLDHCQDLGRFVEATHPDDLARQNELYAKLKAGQTDQYSLEKRYLHPNGDICWASLTLRFVRDAVGDQIQELTTLVDITERKRAEAELEQIHKQLLQTSHQAGMAEVATGVLHNVGNVLNSVNVSATLVADLVRRSKSPNVAKVCDLLEQHRAELGPYLTEDPKGRLIPSYLATLAESLAAEQKTIVGELDSLHKNIGHIKDIVAMQQSYAKTSGVVETISVPDLVEDAIRMNAGSLARHDVDLARQYDGRPVITVEKNKVLQILVNLIRNAKYACDESGRTDKLITIRTTVDDLGVDIAVIDNGVGIPPENLTRIFAHGFTTRKNGHGFGLHSGALAARELGGSLSAHSEGRGLGATFTLTIPLRPAPDSP